MRGIGTGWNGSATKLISWNGLEGIHSEEKTVWTTKSEGMLCRKGVPDGVPRDLAPVFVDRRFFLYELPLTFPTPVGVFRFLPHGGLVVSKRGKGKWKMLDDQNLKLEIPGLSEPELLFNLDRTAFAETPSWTLGDDECQSGGPCALDALQRRGLMRSDDAWKEVMAALVPQIQNLVFQDNELNVAKEMRKAMKGTCLTLDEYRASDRPFSDHWQCGSEGFNNFGDAAYIPSERVIDGLSQFAGLPLKTLAKFHLHSNNDSEALYGKWTWPQNFTKAPNEWPWSEIRMTKPQGPWQLHNHPGRFVNEVGFENS
eukprot:g16258.t1